MKYRAITLIFENIVPNNKNISLGSIDRMSFCENITQMVVITNIDTNGIIGRIASINGLIFPVRFLYDLKIHIIIRMNICNKYICRANLGNVRVHMQIDQFVD